MLYKIKEVAALSGTTTKTLHYYHKINLLIPHYINEYGHRFYNEENLLKLQEILFYRELDFSIKNIISIFKKSLLD